MFSGNTLAMSVSSRLIECFLWLSGSAKDPTEKQFYRKMRKNAIRTKREEKKGPPVCGIMAQKSVYCGMPYYTLIPQEVETTKSILYLHGSAYMNGYRPAQLRFAVELAKQTHAKVYFPLYPKLPFSTFLSCFALLNNFFVFLRKKGEVFPMGDSSGGTLALALALTRSEVKEVIALSPWVSLSVGEEGRRVRSDFMISLGCLDRVASLWAEKISWQDPRLSPIQGTFSGKSLFITSGECERFRPDLLRFCKVQEERGATVTYIEGAKQQHCYPLLPTPEGREARQAITKRLQHALYGDRG